MESGRYHRQVGFPEGTKEALERFFAGFAAVRYSHHAKLETVTDRHGIIPIVKRSALTPERCFEIVVEGGFIVKAGFQVEGETHNHAYVVSCEGVVITCWSDPKENQYRHLDKAQYAQV